MNRWKLGLGSWTGAMCVGLVVACHSDATSNGGAGGAKPVSAAETVCDAVKAYTPACGAASECDQALVTDCTAVTGMLSDGYLAALSSCMKGGGAPLDCLVSALGGLTPTAAQSAFATQFCDQCALGIPGCESTLFTGTGDTAAVGKLILPLSDTLVDSLRTECATGATCAATFNSCAEGVFAKSALPEKTLSCVVESWTSGQSAQMGCGAGGNGSGGAPPSSTSSTSPATTTGTGGNGQSSTTGTGNPTCVAQAPAQLANTDDCESDVIVMHGTIDGTTQVMTQHVSDGICALDPTVQTTPLDLVVCQYFQCDEGQAEVPCPQGTTSAVNADGVLGCCGSGSFAINYNCQGTTDDSVLITYEVKPFGSCVDYDVDLTY